MVLYSYVTFIIKVIKNKSLICRIEIAFWVPVFLPMRNVTKRLVTILLLATHVFTHPETCEINNH